MSHNDSHVEGNLEALSFGWDNYSSFGTMLCISTAIGIYFGFFSKKQENTTEYLLAGKTMSYFPVAMSLTASHLSGVTLLGVPSEVYQFGTQFAATTITTISISLMTAFVFLPVFHKLQLTSTFEYLEVRFARSVRQFASVLYTISLILSVPIVVYIPAIAFSQVTGFSLHFITPVISVVCIFYTTVGGLKAVVWTDTIQFIMTVFSLFTVLVIGVISTGGFAEIWRISDEGGRLIFFNMDPSPFVRTSFWGMVIGLPTSWAASIAVNQGCMQRFLAVPTLSDARKAITIMCSGFVIVKCVSIFTGLIIYAKYHDCDPISTKMVDRPDQILPYYMMDVAGNIPGLPGLFLAALVSSALSCMSAGLNTTAGTIWEDFISPWIPESDTKQRTATKVMKVTVVLLGILCAALVFVVEHMGEIFTISTSMQSITSGTLVGLYTLGVLVPWATYKGAVIGGILGFVASAWVILGAQLHRMNKTIRDVPLPISTDNCPHPLNMTDWTTPTLPPIAPEDEPMTLFTISFLYYSLIGFVSVVVCGTIASFLTGASDLNELNRDHFAPVVRRFLPRERYTKVPLAAMATIPNTLAKEKEAQSGCQDPAN